MTDPATLYGLCGAAVAGVGLYGFVVHANLMRRLLAFNVIGSGVFLLLGAAGDRVTDDGAGGGGAAGGGADPVAQALIITGIVVALAATALGVNLIIAHARLTGRARLPEDGDEGPT